MKPHWYGDSYDIVKRSLLHSLSEFGKWYVHPMLTEAFDEGKLEAFATFIGAEVLCSEILTPSTNRSEYFGCCNVAKNLFLDPDTGLRMNQLRSKKSINYIFAPELIELIQTRPARLTLVFDQSLPRGKELTSVKAKLASMRSVGIHGFAYVSHASFLLFAADENVVRLAYNAVLKHGFPEHRLAR